MPKGAILAFFQFTDYFSDRQLLALTTLTDLVTAVWQRIVIDCTVAGIDNDGIGFHKGGSGAHAYADSVVTYLALGLSRLTDMCNTLCSWESSRTQVRHLFTPPGSANDLALRREQCI